MITAIIPARGGSKRIPRKNIKTFNGAPILQRVIKIVKDSGIFDRILVSTEDGEIARLAVDWGCEVPFIRPKNLAGDFCKTIDVIQHAIVELQNAGWSSRYVCCIYPTSIFLDPQTIRAGYSKLIHSKDKFIISVSEISDNRFLRSMKIDDRGIAKMNFPEYVTYRSQDLPKAFCDAGQFYWASTKTWLNHPDILTSEPLAVELERNSIIDIDNPEDWLAAEKLLATNHQSRK